jgi:hypothetical protein
MSPDQERSVQKVFAEAHKAYLKAMKEGLAEVDIEALDMTSAAPRPDIISIGCWGSWACWYCYHCYGCGACLGCSACDPMIKE